MQLNYHRKMNILFINYHVWWLFWLCYYVYFSLNKLGLHVDVLIFPVHSDNVDCTLTDSWIRPNIILFCTSDSGTCHCIWRGDFSFSTSLHTGRNYGADYFSFFNINFARTFRKPTYFFKVGLWDWRTSFYY